VDFSIFSIGVYSMKFSLKTLAAAAVMAVAASSSFAAIDAGNGGNGELFFNVWDANGSYTRDLNISINSFNTQVDAAGSLDLTFSKDATFTSFLVSADAATLKWNLVAVDAQGDRRLLTTYTLPEVSPLKDNVTSSVTSKVRDFASAVNAVIGTNDSVSVTTSSLAYAGKPTTFGTNLGGLLNFNTTGTLANDSFASGLGFMRIDSKGTGTAFSAYNEYMDGASAVNVYLDASKTLHIAAAPVPEPESYAMLLAGLGMIGFMAGRRNKRA
jgi:hypothetical protein